MGGLIKSKGNMYDWVSHMFSHLGGECGFRCSYCYVDKGCQGRADKYKGPVHIIPGTLEQDFGRGRKLFIEHCNDIMGPDVTDAMVRDILAHCSRYPENEFIIQTKNPERAVDFIPYLRDIELNTKGLLFGTTMETNRSVMSVSKAPRPFRRAAAMMMLPFKHKFVTIEPILDFDPVELCTWLYEIRPEFVNIGADSKGCGLVEPSAEKIVALVNYLRVNGIEIREKHNLARIIGDHKFEDIT